MIGKGVESLDEVEPTEMLIQEAKQVAKVVESFFSLEEESALEEERKPLAAFSANLPIVSLSFFEQMRVNPFVQKRKEVEAHLQKAFVFNKALSEILLYLNKESTRVTEEQMAMHCKEILFLATKTLEFTLHAILTEKNNTQLRYNHNIYDLFREAFADRENIAQEINNCLGNAHLCLRYPLQQKRVYSSVHKVSLAAVKVFCPQSTDSFASIFLQLQQEQMQEPFDFLQEQTTHVLLFAKILFEEHLIDALERMA